MVNELQNERRDPVNPRPSLRWLERGLLTLGLLLMGLWFKNETDARASHSAATRQLEAAPASGQVADAPGDAPAKEPWCPATLESGVFGRIQIPRLGISALIAEGTGPGQLERTVGHVQRTAFPGQAGNCALAGHRDGFLRGLGHVRKSDVIRIDTLQGTYTYVVEWCRVVRPRRLAALESMGTPSLTLMTSDPVHGADSAAERFVVRARLVAPTALAAR